MQRRFRSKRPERREILLINRKTTQNGWLAWSRLRGSNSLPPPWQGGALPDELNLRFSQRCLLYRTEQPLSRAFSKKENCLRQFSPILCGPGKAVVLCCKNQRKPAQPFPERSFSHKKKNHSKWVAGLEQVTSKASETFPSPLLLPLPYGQHFATAKAEGTCFASSSQIPSAIKQKSHPNLGG